jgi:penicillin-binding protein 2
MSERLVPEHDPDRNEVRHLLRDDTKFASGKIAVFQYITVGAFLFLLSGYWQLQVQNPDYYFDRAERNRIRSVPMLAPRGKILDRDGRVIVDSHASFSLWLSRENLEPEHIKAISDGLNLDYDSLMERLRRAAKQPKYQPIIIKEELTSADLAFVEANRSQNFLPEMELNPSQKRLYPRNGMAAHTVGYTGEVSDAELNTVQFAHLRQGDVIGKAGLERQYNDILMGVDGQRRVIVDRDNRERATLENKDAIAGKNLNLTIDLDLQVVAGLAMAGKRGALVALDPRNGEVLAMVSNPAYDPNRFAGRILSKDWAVIMNDPEYPMMNRAIQAQVAPGSTFKPIVALAALAAGEVDDQTEFHCPGGATFYGSFFKCHLASGHGNVSLTQGLAKSCDVYFYNLGNRAGVDRIAAEAELAGFGHKTGIDLPGEQEGTVPSTRWANRVYRRKWYAGETISVAIGQGPLTVTPLQLAHAIGGLIMGGVWHRPHLAKDELPATPPRKAEVNPDHLRSVIAGLCAVVADGGTGVSARLANVEVCGKTGTAQLISNKLAKSGKLKEAVPDNAWFFGFAPRENPEIVVVALYEGGGHGPEAAPIVRDVIKSYFDKKSRTGQKGLVASR